jgi:hypothetical protein
VGFNDMNHVNGIIKLTDEEIDEELMCVGGIQIKYVFHCS